MVTSWPTSSQLKCSGQIKTFRRPQNYMAVASMNTTLNMPQLKDLGLLQACEQSAGWTLLSWLCNDLDLHIDPVVGLGLGGRGKTKKGALWWSYHNQPTVIITFDLPKIQSPKDSSSDYSKTEIAGQNATGCSWYTTLKALKVGKTWLKVRQ